MRMNSKFGKRMVFMAILLVSIAFIPAASASSGKEATSTSAVFTPAIESLKDAGILTTYSITAGQTRNHYTPINNPGWHYFRVDLNWIPSSSSLRLTITSPTGEVFGPWTDSSDGSLDGRIQKTIQKPAGLATGTWTSTVYGVSGSATYSYNVYIS